MANIAKDIVQKALKKKGVPLSKFLMDIGIYPCDYYQAVNGKKPFFPAWKKRISNALNMPEDKLFPDEKVEER